jgi:lysophospholipase L1-like esterase
MAAPPAAGVVAHPLGPAPVRRVVGLGDSVSAGTACGCTPYADLVGAALAKVEHTSVRVDNMSVAGQTTRGLLAQLGQPGVAAAVRHADAVLVTIGANDLEEEASCTPGATVACYAGDLRALSAAYPQLLERLRELLAPRARLVVTGYWSVFLDGTLARQKGSAYVRASDALTRAVNGIIASAATAAAATYIDVFTPFKGDGDLDDTSLLAPDGDHPNARGHQVIASAITAALVP